MKNLMIVLLVLALAILWFGCNGNSIVEPLVGDLYAGGLIWNNFTNTIAGGSGYPAGFDSANKDFLRCKACHGWDALGLNGGYVRRTSSPTRPNPTADTDLSSEFGDYVVEDVWHANGRAFGTLNSNMPAFDQTGGLTDQQAADVLAFLNSGPKIEDYATLNPTANPVAYTFTNPDLAQGETLYDANCVGCHSTVGSQTGGTGPAMGPFFAEDGKYSEGFHKMVYGAGGDFPMTRASAGNLTGQQAANILAYIQSETSGDPLKGGLIWNNWTDTISGGTGYPAGYDSANKDFLRCKACHGWDALGLNGGYVRRTSSATRPIPTDGTDLSDEFGGFVTADVWHTNGRDFATLDMTMPAFDQTGGLTVSQAADVLAFLNSGPKVEDFATLDVSVDPVAYTFTTFDLANGESLYGTNCQSCHSTVDSTTGGVGPALGPFFEEDGKFSEGFHKMYYGAGSDSIMTRAAAGDLTAQQVVDIMAYIQSTL